MLRLCKRLLLALARRPVRALLVVLLLGAIGGGLALGAAHLWAGYHFRAARRELERYNFQAASAHLDQCLQVWPRDAEARLLAARAARRAGHYRLAESHLTRCKAVLGGMTSDALSLEWALLAAGRSGLDGHEQRLRSHAENHPADAALVLEVLAGGYVDSLRLYAALDALERLLALEPDHHPALAMRGWVYERFHQGEKAAADYRRVAELAPHRADVRTRLGEVLLILKRYEEAAAEFEALRESRPDDPEVGTGLARAYLALGRKEEAREVLAAVLAAHPRHGRALAERGALALNHDGDPGQAVEWLRKAIEADPFDRPTNYLYYQALAQRGGPPEEAEAQLERLNRIDADLDRLDEIILKKLRKTPNDPALYHEVGEIFLRNGQEAWALRWLNAALRTAPYHRPTHETLAEYYRRQGNDDEADHHAGLAGERPR